MEEQAHPLAGALVVTLGTMLAAGGILVAESGAKSGAKAQAETEYVYEITAPNAAHLEAQTGIAMGKTEAELKRLGFSNENEKEEESIWTRKITW